jgi:hypothetical protein
MPGYVPQSASTRAGAPDVTVKLVSVAAALSGKPAPEFEVSAWVSGEPMTLQSLRGQVVLLHIGVTTGGAYPDNYRPIYAAKARFIDKPFTVLVIHRYQLSSAGRGAARGAGAGAPMGLSIVAPITLPMAIDADRRIVAIDQPAYQGETARLYGIEDPPAMILIDKQGIVRAAPNLTNLETWIEKLLAE